MLRSFEDCLETAEWCVGEYASAKTHSEIRYEIAYSMISMLLYISFKTKYNRRFDRAERASAAATQRVLLETLERLFESRMEKFKPTIETYSSDDFPAVTDRALAGIGGKGYPSLISEDQLDGSIVIDDGQLGAVEELIASSIGRANLESFELPSFADPNEQEALLKSGYPTIMTITLGSLQ